MNKNESCEGQLLVPYVINNDAVNDYTANEQCGAAFAFPYRRRWNQKWHLGIKNNTKQEIIPQLGHTRLGTDLRHFQFGWRLRRRKGVRIIYPLCPKTHCPPPVWLSPQIQKSPHLIENSYGIRNGISGGGLGDLYGGGGGWVAGLSFGVLQEERNLSSWVCMQKWLKWVMELWGKRIKISNGSGLIVRKGVMEGQKDEWKRKERGGG